MDNVKFIDDINELIKILKKQENKKLNESLLILFKKGFIKIYLDKKNELCIIPNKEHPFTKKLHNILEKIPKEPSYIQ